MREKIIEILSEIKSDIDYENNTSLVDDGELESLDIVALIGSLNSEFDIRISVNELVPENFNSVDAMVNLVEKLQD